MPNWSEEGQKKILEASKRGRNTISDNLKRLKDSYYKSPKLCDHCGLAIPYEKRVKSRFCSHSCSAKESNVKRAKSKNCMVCGAKVKRGSSKYCSRSCELDNKYKEKLDSWKQGEYLTKSKEFFRKYLTETYGYKCSCCGVSDWNGKPLTLEIDHIDGNSENNSPENLRFICPNCHSQTETYKGKNRGNGRHYRRNRYKEGKSY